MRNLIFASILILIFCICVFSQTVDKSVCPEITLTSDPATLISGSIISYTVSLDNKAGQYDVKYLWNVKVGVIFDGQGTQTIKIQRNADSLLVKAEIEGLPQTCSNSVSESIFFDRPPSAFLIANFSISASQTDKVKLDKLVTALQNDPNARACIFEKFEKKTTQKLIRRKLAGIIRYLVVIRGVERNRVVLQSISSIKNSTQLWIVPSGAGSPEI